MRLTMRPYKAMLITLPSTNSLHGGSRAGSRAGRSVRQGKKEAGACNIYIPHIVCLYSYNNRIEPSGRGGASRTILYQRQEWLI